MVKFHGAVALTRIVLLKNQEEGRHYGNDWIGWMALRSKSFSYFSLLALFRAPGYDIYLAVKHAKLACFHILEPNFRSVIAF